MSAAKIMRNILMGDKDEKMDIEHPVLQEQYDDGYDEKTHKPV